MIDAIQGGKRVLFMDEAVFTANQVSPKVWFSPQKQPVMLEKKKLAFKAIAVAAAIDTEGNVVAAHIVDGAINGDEFLIFLDKVAAHTNRRKTIMLLDNLKIHHMYCVKRKADRMRLELLFNGTYSSTFNPIERLWAWAKQRFQKRCVDDAPYHNQAHMRRLVENLVRQDYSHGLKQHIQSCLFNMQQWLDQQQ